MIHLVRNFNDLRVLSSSLYDFPLITYLTILRQPLVCFKRVIPKKKGLLYSQNGQAWGWGGGGITGPEPVSAGALKSQHENKVSGEAQVFNTQAEEKSEKKNIMGGNSEHGDSLVPKDVNIRYFMSLVSNFLDHNPQ